jgi:hypothetical protein
VGDDSLLLLLVIQRIFHNSTQIAVATGDKRSPTSVMITFFNFDILYLSLFAEEADQWRLADLSSMT